MTNTNETRIEKHASGKKLIVTRSFNAPLEKVWRAWTEPQLLDQWWAPKPWKTETRNLDLKTGGQWFYAMVGPQGEKQWCIVDFEEVTPQISFTGLSSLCDEDGNRNNVMPPMRMANNFKDAGQTTTVTVDVIFDSEEDLEKVSAMGFKEGFTMAHGNLDELLEK